ncbi:MAG: threonylcarbamoyl-AMP synthase [Bacteroidales bacterium]|nr:threonylcarbamoyl-AMP synthase [Bacteroidales bacterium]
MEETFKEVITSALDVLKKGGVILYPTDTVWGLGCDATNEEAVQRLFEIKKRPGAKSMVLLASDMDMVARFVRKIPDMAIDLVEVNDKPMTIIYPGAEHLAPSTVADDGSVGIRIPVSNFCLELIRRFRKPITSTSANISGDPTPLEFDDIPAEIRDAVDYVVPPEILEDKIATGHPSQIIKVEVDGRVKVIRD